MADQAEARPTHQDIATARFVVRLLCADCGAELNRTHPLDAETLQQDWTQIVLTSGMQAGPCPHGCRATFSDLNINTNLRIVDAATAAPVEFRLFKLLAGRFYSEDHDQVCVCPEQPAAEVYQSARYPAVHGRCGRWLVAYSVADRDERQVQDGE